MGPRTHYPHPTFQPSPVFPLPPPFSSHLPFHGPRHTGFITDTGFHRRTDGPGRLTPAFKSPVGLANPMAGPSSVTTFEEPTVSPSERFAEILRILIKHDAVGLVRQYGQKKGPVAKPGEAEYGPTRVRLILEELGPTFIKIGQLLGTRPDLVPADLIEEFKKLFDQTTPNPYSDIKEVVERELGKRVDEVFAHFEPIPLASASIGQVHRAVLRSGEEVVVKVQHPGIEAAVQTDFQILERLARFTERVFAKSRVWQPTEHLEELRHMLDKELDYNTERKAIKRVAHNFRHNPDVKIPTVYDEYSTRRVMVMEFVKGHKLSVLEHAAPAGLDADDVDSPTSGPRVARIVTHAMAKQIFIDRFFHADPSPGNILVCDDGSVAFLDWGAVGAVTRRRSRAIFNLISNMSRGDSEAVARNITELCDVRGEVDQKAYLTDVEKLLDYYEKEGASPADPVILDRIIQLANDHNMLLPPDFMLITRALYQFEGFCRAIDPDYELVSVLKPYVANVMKEVLYGPDRQKEMMSTLITDYGDLLQHLPGRISNIVRKVEKDEITLQHHIMGLAGWKQANAKNARILSFSIIMAALIIGLSVVLATGAVDLVGSFFFLGSFVVILWALVMLGTTWTLWRGE